MFGRSKKEIKKLKDELYELSVRVRQLEYDNYILSSNYPVSGSGSDDFKIPNWKAINALAIHLGVGITREIQNRVVVKAKKGENDD